MDIGSVRRVIQVTLQPAPTRPELKVETEPEGIEEDADER